MLRMFETEKKCILNSEKKCVLSIDIETSGSNMKKNGLLSIGATIVDDELNELDYFYVNIELSADKEFEKKCWDEFWSKNPEALENIKKNAIPADQAMKQFTSFLNKVDKEFNKLIIVSDNPCYDVAWINLYLSDERLPIYYKLRDDKKNDWRSIEDVRVAMQTLCKIEGHTTVKKISDMMNILGFTKKETWKHDHHALSDARYIAANYWQTENKIKELNEQLNQLRNQLTSPQNTATQQRKV